MTFPRFISLVKHPKYKDQNDCCEEKKSDSDSKDIWMG